MIAVGPVWHQVLFTHFTALVRYLFTMNPLSRYLLGTCLASLALTGCNRKDQEMQAPAPIQAKRSYDEAAALQEANALLTTAATLTGTTKEDVTQALTASTARYSRQQNVFFPGVLAIDFKRKQVTLPLYKGLGPSGKPVYYILTEAASFNVARILGVNFSPKLVYGRDSDGSQEATIVGGLLKFEGDVDFSPVRKVAPGTFPNTFPPAVAQPGAVGDSKYSPLVVLPSGSVINAPIVANSTGTHDHLVSIDYARGRVVFELLDGFQGGDEYYFHLVTESSDIGAATIERGTYTPRLGNLPTFGQSLPTDESALLGFSPVSNGETGPNNPQRQGLNSTILDGTAYDPINVFPLDPDNQKQYGNNYSPMWDAHINAWTPAAIAAGKRRRIRSIEDLTNLVKQGYVTNAPGNYGEPNGFIAGLLPSHVVINCPVMAQPDKSLVE